MGRTTDVAIIGVSGLLPNAESFAALHDALLHGGSGVTVPSADRLRFSGARLDADYPKMGYLDRIDLFDHEFFGMTPGEAVLMDPQQRLALQLVHTAIENAGYAAGDLRGSRTAVVLSASDTGYESLVDDDPQLLLGLARSAVAARISYVLDLHGRAAVVDTACSSALAAVATAVEYLRHGEATVAIAGGVNVNAVLMTRQDMPPPNEIISPDETCRPFDVDANGAIPGEGGGFVVLKPLTDALADGDNVHAVIRGVAVNHNGFRATGMSAPSPVGQAEVVMDAWRDADIDGRDVTYVECHGTGTRLGDVIEVDGLNRAFAVAGAGPGHCAIGSVKGDVGHLDHAAGIAGLLKVVSALRSGVRYPAPNYTAPNPMIDFTGAVHVGAQAEDWPRPPGGARQAGVSSFGLTGTNVHIVLEEAPGATRAEQPQTAELVTLSARTPAALAKYCESVAEFAAGTGHGLRSVAHTLNRGRDDFPYRVAATVDSLGRLTERLKTVEPPARPVGPAPKVVLLIPGDGHLDEWASLEQAFPSLRGQQVPGPAGRLHALCLLAAELGIPDATLTGSGLGNVAIDLFRGRITAEQAAELALNTDNTAEPNREGLRRAIRGWLAEDTVLVELCPGGTLSARIAELEPGLRIESLTADPTREGVLAVLGRLYEHGVKIDWHRHYQGQRIPRIEAPSYPFDLVRCWPGDQPRQQDFSWATPTQRRIAEIWLDVLKVDGLGPDSDYFELGGTSIAGMTVLRRINAECGARVRFIDLYEFRTIRALADHVEKTAGTPDGPSMRITPVARTGSLPLSLGQRQLWLMQQLYPDTPLYNIPIDLRFHGPLDVPALEGALRDLIDRHEVFRTGFVNDDGEPRGILVENGFALSFVDLSGLPEDERDRRVRRRIAADATAPIDLEHGPLGEATVLKLADDDHVFAFTVHHVAYDGGASLIFYRELNELYDARLRNRPHALPPLRVQYADYAAWQQEWLKDEGVNQSRAFWREQLADIVPTDLPTDHPRPVERTYAGDFVEFTVPLEITNRVREFSRRHHVTTFTTMLAVVNAFLHRWAGLTDVVVGSPTSGRFNPDTHGLIGYFNNVLPMRVAVDGGLSFDELVRRCATVAATTLDHEAVPIDVIVSDVRPHRDPGRNPLFDVCYVHQNSPTVPCELTGTTTSRYVPSDVYGVAPGTAKFDLTMGVAEDGVCPLLGYFEYSTDLFDRSTIEWLVERFQALLVAAIAQPAADLAVLPFGGRALSTLPLTAHGKLDRAAPKEIAMPHSPTVPNGQMKGRFSPTERALADIWCDTLEIDRVRAHDGFFDLGGDSFLAIRVVARAARAGIRLRPQDLLRHQTLEDLAAFVDESADESRDDSGEPAVATGAGPTPLTPIQRHFMANMSTKDRWGPSMALETPVGATPEIIRRIVRHIVDRHEVLRARFRHNGLDWLMEYLEAEPHEIVQVKPISQDVDKQFIYDTMNSMIPRLDLLDGPLVQTTFLDRGAGAPGLLLIAVNHFASDNMSFPGLLDDLDTAWEAISTNRPLPPRPQTSAWRTWVRDLHEKSTSDTLAAELPYWTQTLRDGASLDDLDGPPGSAADAKVVIRHIEESQVPAVMRGQGEMSGREAAMCAVAVGVARWTGRDGAYMMLEGDGNPNAYSDVDRSLAVGWFTSVHPAAFEVDPAATVTANTPRLLEQIRSRPNDGVGYGMLRHLAPQAPDVAELRSLPEPRILFDHIAADAASLRVGTKHFRPRSDILMEPEPITECFPLTLTITVDNGSLRVAAIHAGHYPDDSMAKLVDHLVQAITELP